MSKTSVSRIKTIFKVFGLANTNRKDAEQAINLPPLNITKK